jgi:hypothetical protein
MTKLAAMARQALEQQAKINARQAEISAKLDVLLERATAAAVLNEVLATHDAQLAEA